MLIAGPQYFIDDIAVISKKNETLASFVQSSDWKDSCFKMNKVDNIGLVFAVCGTGDPFWFVESKIYPLFLFTNSLSVYSDLVTFLHPISFNCIDVVDRHPALFYQAIRFSAAAKATVTDIFVQADIHKKSWER
jgi:hypothetical protein